MYYNIDHYHVQFLVWRFLWAQYLSVPLRDAMVHPKWEMKLNLIIIQPWLLFIKFSQGYQHLCQVRERRNWVPECWTCRKDKWFENSDLRRLQIFWNCYKCKRKLINTNILISLDLTGRFSALPCASTCGWAVGAAFEGLEIMSHIFLCSLQLTAFERF